MAKKEEAPTAREVEIARWEAAEKGIAYYGLEPLVVRFYAGERTEPFLLEMEAAIAEAAKETPTE